jgi:hypothetical protein
MARSPPLAAGHSRAHALAYQSRGSYLELTPAKFAAYLAEEGLAWALAERRCRGEEDIPARERRALRHGAGRRRGRPRRPTARSGAGAGAEANPYLSLQPGAADAPVARPGPPARSALPQANPRAQVLRTDAEGRVVVRADAAALAGQGGTWRADDDPRAEGTARAS